MTLPYDWPSALFLLAVVCLILRSGVKAARHQRERTKARRILTRVLDF